MVKPIAVHPMRIERVRQGLTQEALSTLAGVARETVSRAECFHQQPHRLTLKAIAAVLNVEPDSLRV